MTVEFGLIGPGSIADRHLAPALRKVEGARLWSVLSRDPGRALDFAQRHRAAAPNPAPATLDAMLADPRLDAVLIATPDNLHAEQTIAAARAGKHVLVEKPMATDLGEARRMIEVCRENRVRLGVAYHLRWHAGHRALLERIRAGELGRIRHVRAQWTWWAGDATNWRASEDLGRWWSLGGVGTHCLDLVRWILVPEAGEVSECRSMITRDVHRGPHDETALLALRFERGTTAELCSSVLFEGPTRLEVYGEKNFAICEGTLGAHGTGTIRIGNEKLAFTPTDPYAGEIADFAKAVRDGRPPAVDGYEGRRNIELLFEALTGSR